MGNSQTVSREPLIGASVTMPSKADDYPDYAAAVPQQVPSGRCERGLLICGSGVGVAELPGGHALAPQLGRVVSLGRSEE